MVVFSTIVCSARRTGPSNLEAPAEVEDLGEGQRTWRVEIIVDEVVFLLLFEAKNGAKKIKYQNPKRRRCWPLAERLAQDIYKVRIARCGGAFIHR